MKVEVLRIGQRIVRDDRVTTHVALVARAFGASKIYMNEVDPEIENTIKRMNKTWGGDFKIEFFEDWKKVLKSKIDDYKIVHLTMYGEKIDEVENCLDISALTGKNLTELKKILEQRFYGESN